MPALMVDTYAAALTALKDGGLDTDDLQSFLDKVDFLPDWPEGCLAEYMWCKFEKVDVDTSIHPTSELVTTILGVKPDQAKELVRLYEECSVPGDDIGKYLADYFTVLARGAAATADPESAGPNFQILLDLYQQPIIKRVNLQEVFEMPVAQGATSVPFEYQAASSKAGDWASPFAVNKTCYKLIELPAGENYFYHSTDMSSASSILVSGPFSRYVTRYPRDFDSGFYLNESKSMAIQWSKTFSKGPYPATILVYKLTEEVRALWKVQDLTVSHSRWEQVVIAFRTQKFTNIDLRRLLECTDAFYGPICMNPMQAFSPSPRLVASSSNQLTIVNDLIAANLNDYLYGIYFVS